MRYSTLNFKSILSSGMRFSLPLLFLGILAFRCSSQAQQHGGKELIYDFRAPDQVIELVEELNEISGLDWHNGKLVSLQDENGIVFFLDPDTGAIVDKLKFDKKGDTEGICVKDGSIYALQSDGDIFVIEDMDEDEVKRYQTGLKENCEGLCVSSKTGELLIACKDKGKDSDREIYGISVKRLKKEKKPKVRYGIDGKDLKEVLLTNAFDRISFAFHDVLTPSDNGDLLNPSGIAEHPLNHSLYILSGTSGMLVVLYPNGKFHTVIPLPAEYLPQPEGICFSPKGDLYISSEKNKKKTAHLVKFGYRGQ